MCGVDGCGLKLYAKGLCTRHYQQTPRRRAWGREYHQRPEVKARMKEYYKRPEAKLVRLDREARKSREEREASSFKRGFFKKKIGICGNCGKRKNTFGGVGAGSRSAYCSKCHGKLIGWLWRPQRDFNVVLSKFKDDVVKEALVLDGECLDKELRKRGVV